MALCAVALCAVSRQLFHQGVDIPYRIFAASGTLFIYNLQRVVTFSKPGEISRKKSQREEFITGNHVLLSVITILSGIVCGMTFILYLFERIRPVMLIFPTIISLAYALPVIRTKNCAIRLRDIPFIKIVLIALVWSFVTAYLPISDSFSTNKDFLYSGVHGFLWTLSNFFFILALTIPFDIRDMKVDDEKLRSIPLLFGLQKAKIISVTFLSLSLFSLAAFNFLLYSDYGFFPYHFLIAFSLWIVLCIPVVLLANPERKEYYFSFLVDGMLIALYGMILIARYV